MAETTTKTQGLRKYACLSCQSRKVKCDRRDPCSTCERASVTCIFRPPAPPRRRQRRTTEELLQARLKQYEKILQEMGVKIAPETIQDKTTANTKHGNDQFKQVGNKDEDMDVSVESLDTTSKGNKSPTSNKSEDRQGSSTNTERCNERRGRFYSNDGKSRYLENYLWTTVGDEIQDSDEVLGEAQPFGFKASTSHNWQLGGGDMFFGINTQNISFRSQHPSFTAFQELWDKFMENINPLMKVVHIPTLEAQLFKAYENLDTIPKELETMMFAIYAITTSSITESECEKFLRESKSSALTRYFDATRQCLIRVGFLQSSSMTVLQAFTMFLLAIRPYYDSRSLWTLSGIAVRIGQGMGLHCDGATLNLLFFEAEMRRRLWWQIVMIDNIATHNTGAGTSILTVPWDVKLPLNLDDADLDPSMKDAPEERLGSTEMMNCLLRYNFGAFHRNHNPVSMFDGSWSKLSDPGSTLAQKNKGIDHLEKVFQDKFLKYCDPLDPLEFFVSVVTRCAFAQMRLVANHPRNMGKHNISGPVLDRDALFELSTKVIEYLGLLFSSRFMQRYMWHICQHFPWHALVFLLTELRQREPSRQVDRAWQQVFIVYEHKPELMLHSQHPLHRAVCNLTLKAWEGDKGSQHAQGLPPRPIPPIIQELYARKTAMRSAPVAVNIGPSTSDAHNSPSGLQDCTTQQEEMNPTGPHINQLGVPITPDSLNSDGTVDWSAWDELFNLEFSSTVDMPQPFLS